MTFHRFAGATLAIAAMTFALQLTACAGSEDKTIVSVNGEKITKSALDNRLENQAGKTTLQQMVDTQLVLQYGKQAGINPTDAQIQDQVTQLEQRFPPGQFDSILKQQGLTMDDVKTIEKVQLIIKQAVDKQINISQADITDFYNKNRTMYNTPAQVRARHILVKTKAQADAILAQLQHGADFATLAKQYSDDPGSKAQGGELGWFSATQMVAPFAQAAFALNVGQISQPVNTPFGWHIIQVEGKRPAHQASLAEVEPKIRDSLVEQQEAAQGAPFIQQLRDKANIQVFDDRFNPLFPPPAGMPMGTSAPQAQPSGQ
ncbi:MAG TPA: peptidylprolyl isomerase [Candidatus Acidoferrales bacterium]|nr:peptidylprolyl isomerase [Candidatus Acidoferrales bacterium]